MTEIPTLRGDATAAFLAEGYPFGHRRFESVGGDAFRARLQGRRVTLFRGHRAVRGFYEGDRFARPGAIPRSVVHSLQDVGSVQTLTGDPHRQRKSLFTSVLDAVAVADLDRIFTEEWHAAQTGWATRRSVSLLEASGQVLGSAALRWLGVPETAEHRRALTNQCLAMIDGAGSFGPRNWCGRIRRRATERWALGTVRAAREGAVASDTPIGRLVTGLAGADDRTIAVELLNLLRPTVAVSRFVMFAGLALHEHPQWRDAVATEVETARAFAQEVRRTTPLFPAVGGLATEDLDLAGVPVRTGDWVLVDLFATDRHPGEWAHAWRFDPSRFLQPSAPPVVAQGAGDVGHTHHCPGETATVDLLTTAVQLLADLPWRLPPQDLRVDLRRLPAEPASRVRIEVDAS